MTYDEFIEYNKTRDQGPYFHWHHIIPKSDGGTNDESNLIKLSWATHWYAHQLLLKETGKKTAATSCSLDTWLRKSYYQQAKMVELANKRAEKHEQYWFNNGIENKRAAECPEGYVKGRLVFKDHKAKLKGKWYNNGVINVRAAECPEGFTEGRIITEDYRDKLRQNGKKMAKSRWSKK